MSWKELKTLLFKCDRCPRTKILVGITDYHNPPGWGYKHPENPHSMFEKSLDLCPDCLYKEKNEQKR